MRRWLTQHAGPLCAALVVVTFMEVTKTFGLVAAIAAGSIALGVVCIATLYLSTHHAPHGVRSASAPASASPTNAKATVEAETSAEDTSPTPSDDPERSSDEHATSDDLVSEVDPANPKPQEDPEPPGDPGPPKADSLAEPAAPETSTSTFPFEEFRRKLVFGEHPLEYLQEQVRAIRSAELPDSDAPAPCPFERFFARRLEEAGLFDDKGDEALPPVRVVMPRHSGLFYVRPDTRELTYAAYLRMLRIEETLNAILAAHDHFGNGLSQTSEERLYQLNQRLTRSICTQAPDVDTADWSYLAMPWQAGSGPADQGEWALRQALSEAIESVRVPYRLEATFRANVAGGDVAIEVALTPAQAFPASAYVEGIGIVSTTTQMRAREASDYGVRLGILLASHAFHAGARVRRVWVSGIERTPSSRTCRYSVCFDRRAFCSIRLGAIQDPLAILRGFGAHMTSEGGRLLATTPSFYLEDERFCPRMRHDLWQLSERPLAASAAFALGATRVSGLVIHEELPRMIAAEHIIGKLDVPDQKLTTEQSVRAILEETQRTSDLSVHDAAERIVGMLVDGTIDASDTTAIEDEMLHGDRMSRLMERAQRLLVQKKPQEALDLLSRELASMDRSSLYRDTSSVAYRCFGSFAERTLYNRINAEDKRSVVLVPDAYVSAHILLAALLTSVDDDEHRAELAAEAQRHAQIALTIAPLSTAANLGAAACYERAGELELASRQLAGFLDVAYDPQGIGLAYYRLAGIQAQLDNPRVCQACYQRSVQALPPLIPLVMGEIQQLVSQGFTFEDVMDNDEVQSLLRDHDIPLSPTERTSYLLYDCAAASVDAEVFPVAHDFMRILEFFTGDDVIRSMRNSLEHEPDV